MSPPSSKHILYIFLCVFATFLVTNAHPFRHSTHGRYASHDYRDAFTKSILFFEGQRSGKLPPNQRMSWRKDSGLSDGSDAHVDLVGGYYDAGDNVKFGFPMAFTTTMLSWSVLEFGGLMKSELQNAKEAVRWASDYLLKAPIHPDTIYVQMLTNDLQGRAVFGRWNKYMCRRCLLQWRYVITDSCAFATAFARRNLFQRRCYLLASHQRSQQPPNTLAVIESIQGHVGHSTLSRSASNSLFPSTITKHVVIIP